MTSRGCRSPTVVSVIVPAEDLRLSERTVEVVLPDEATLLSGDLSEATEGAGVGFLALMVLLPSVGEDAELFVEVCGEIAGATTDLRTGVLFDEADAVELVERIEAVEGVRFAAGERFARSTGDSDGRFPFARGVAEGTRGLVGVLEVDVVPAVLMLTVETVEAVDTLLGRVVAGESSDFAVSKLVEASLALATDIVDVDRVDAVDDGLDKPEGGRRVEGPATFLRRVEAVDRVDLVDAATDRGLGVEWCGLRIVDCCVLTVVWLTLLGVALVRVSTDIVEFALEIGTSSSSCETTIDEGADGEEETKLGESFESGLGPVGRAT